MEEAATGRPESAALIVAGPNLASLATSEADRPRRAISKPKLLSLDHSREVADGVWPYFVD